MFALELKHATVADLALRLHALRGTAAYAAYVVPLHDVPEIVAELDEDLHSFDPSVEVAVLDRMNAADLLGALADSRGEIMVVSATTYGSDDWKLLDRRRSSLAHPGVTVFIMTTENFDDLMRTAPNLASWLGGLVFQHSAEAQDLEETRERQLVSLRAWARKSDSEIVQAAIAGLLPADPEYGEWLVLLGRGDLLDRVK
jgi:hypothetical protein